MLTMVGMVEGMMQYRDETECSGCGGNNRLLKERVEVCEGDFVGLVVGAVSTGR